MTTSNSNDLEAACHKLCQSGKYDIGEGRCALICLDQLGSPRDKPHGCPHAVEVLRSLVEENEVKNVRKRRFSLP